MKTITGKAFLSGVMFVIAIVSAVSAFLLVLPIGYRISCLLFTVASIILCANYGVGAWDLERWAHRRIVVNGIKKGR
ncbi:MAG: hypothetical protein RBT11_19715 [Desulfobacterales bacterium]|jgi:hypothetical protein|nr:hypothetical protein [Desulfobacterales bacterium]